MGILVSREIVKNMKERKLKPFAGRLTRSIMLTQLIVMGLASVLIYVLVHRTMKNEELEVYKNYLVATHAKVERALADVHVGMVNHMSEIEGSLEQPDHLYAITKCIVEQNSHIRSCGISFVDNYYPQKGHQFSPCAVREEDGQITKRMSDDVRNDYLNQEWFTEALKAGKSYWSKPFFDPTDSVTPLVSYLMPIRNKQGQTVAILNADISLNWLNSLSTPDFIRFQHNQEGDTAADSTSVRANYGLNIWKERQWRFVTIYFIIDKDGTFISHPNKSRIIRDNYFECAKETTDPGDDFVGQRMVAGEKGVYGDEDGNADSFKFFDIPFFSVYTLYEPIEHTDWSIGLAVPGVMIDGFSIGMGVILLLLILLALFVVLVIGWIYIRRTTKPLKQLAGSAKEISKGRFNAPLPWIKHNDEIRLLRDSFKEMQHSLTKYIDELKTTTASKAAIDNELRVAHDIQMGMLPKTFPPYPDRDDIDVYGQLTPAKEVGGDLFDFFIRDEQFYFCIGDVSGKGVPASLVMAVTRSLLRNISAHTSEPSHIVATLNNTLSEGNNTNMFVTLFVGVLNLKNGLLRYCNAGHDAPLLMKDTVKTLPVESNLPVGVMADWKYVAQEICLDRGTVVFLYTDGLNEAENITHEQFGVQRVINVAQQAIAGNDNQIKSVVNRMTAAVHDFVGDAEQSDDLTMLAIGYQGVKNEA